MPIKTIFFLSLLLTISIANAASGGKIEFIGRITEGTCSHFVTAKKLVLSCYRGGNGMNKYKINIKENMSSVGRIDKKIGKIHLALDNKNKGVKVYTIAYN